MTMHSKIIYKTIVYATLRRRKVKTQQVEVILDLCLRKTRVRRKSHDYRGVIVLEKLRFQNVFCQH